VNGKKLEDKPDELMATCDAQGQPDGQSIARKEAHKSPGTKHLAVQVLLFNSDKKLLMHHRHSRKIGGNVLDVPTTHILAGETKKEAARRCLENEYGVREEIEFVELPGFSYEAGYEDGTCENEFCYVNVAVFDGEIKPNLDEMESQPIEKSISEIIEELKSKPDDYPAWFHETMRVFRESSEFKKFK